MSGYLTSTALMSHRSSFLAASERFRRWPYITALFVGFLIVVGLVENLWLKKPINGLTKVAILAVVLFLGIRWAPTDFISQETGIPQSQTGAPTISVSQCPVSHPIKAVFSGVIHKSCIYHVPGGTAYYRTDPNWCYANRNEAIADGCKASD